MIKNSTLNIELLQGYKEKLNSAILTKMITLYTQQAELYLNDIESALPPCINEIPSLIASPALPLKEPALEEVTEHYGEWKTACHKMKGAAASVGLLEVYELSKVMELMQDNRDEKVAFFIRLKQINKEGINAFLAYCQ